MDMEENPMAAARRARAAGKATIVNNPTFIGGNVAVGVAIDDENYEMPSEDASSAPITTGTSSNSTIYAEYAPGMSANDLQNEYETPVAAGDSNQDDGPIQHTYTARALVFDHQLLRVRRAVQIHEVAGLKSAAYVRCIHMPLGCSLL
jgi:hypothetical protein